MTRWIIARTVSVCMTALIFAACVSPSPYLDSQFGAATELNKAMQTRDPDAASKHRARYRLTEYDADRGDRHQAALKKLTHRNILQCYLRVEMLLPRR